MKDLYLFKTEIWKIVDRRHSIDPMTHYKLFLFLSLLHQWLDTVLYNKETKFNIMEYKGLTSLCNCVIQECVASNQFSEQEILYLSSLI